MQDVLNLGLEVPTMYLVPKKRFDRLRGINFCEVEFPTVCVAMAITSGIGAQAQALLFLKNSGISARQ
jgi:hypothetical protein